MGPVSWCLNISATFDHNRAATARGGMRNEPTGYGGRFSQTSATKPGIRGSSHAGSVLGTRPVAALSVARLSHAMTKHIRQQAILQGRRSSSARIQTAANKATRTAMRRKTLASACCHGMQPDPLFEEKPPCSLLRQQGRESDGCSLAPRCRSQMVTVFHRWLA